MTPTDAEYKAVAWSSSDNEVASVDNHGVITARGNGSCEIRVRSLDGRHIDTCKVTVEGVLVTKGDVDADTHITANDALMALQAATGKIHLTDGQAAAADVDGKAGVTANDALMILQYVTKKITSFS